MSNSIFLGHERQWHHDNVRKAVTSHHWVCIGAEWSKTFHRIQIQLMEQPSLRAQISFLLRRSSRKSRLTPKLVKSTIWTSRNNLPWKSGSGSLKRCAKRVRNHHKRRFSNWETETCSQNTCMWRFLHQLRSKQLNACTVRLLYM